MPLPDPERLAKSQHLPIDRRKTILRIHRPIARPSHLAIPVMQGKKDLLIERLGTPSVSRVDHQKPMQSRILPLFQILPGKSMRVIPAKPARRGRKGVASVASGRNHRRPLLHRAIQVRRQKKPMPMHDLFAPRPVRHIDRHRFPLAKPQQRPRHLPVISHRLDAVFRRNFQGVRRNFKRIIRRRRHGHRSCPGRQPRCSRQSPDFQKPPPSNHALNLAGPALQNHQAPDQPSPTSPGREESSFVRNWKRCSSAGQPVLQKPANPHTSQIQSTFEASRAAEDLPVTSLNFKTAHRGLRQATGPRAQEINHR
jgi:hypothetical protein